MLKATLTYVEKGKPLQTATAMAELDGEDESFLARHADHLRSAAQDENNLLSRFQPDSAIPALLEELLAAEDTRFIAICGALAGRLQASMDQSTNPYPGVLAIVTMGEGDNAESVSILKLDAVTEAARMRIARGQVKLSVFRDLLPAPGNLQKGISWPDPRASDAIVIDRNPSAARYFFNPYDLLVSRLPREAERALAAAIIRDVPRRQRAAAMEFSSSLSGPAQEVATQVVARYPNVRIDDPALGGGTAPGGNIRQGKVGTHKVRFRADDITVTLPTSRFDRITGPRRVGDHWEITIRFNDQPIEEPA
ncbi:MAG TPA: nucleoid-associated protein [Actinomycetota bacterium]|nr:nucleoid-associated protein [Actinomycetota bacterium]